MTSSGMEGTRVQGLRKAWTEACGAGSRASKLVTLNPSKAQATRADLLAPRASLASLRLLQLRVRLQQSCHAPLAHSKRSQTSGGVPTGTWEGYLGFGHGWLRIGYMRVEVPAGASALLSTVPGCQDIHTHTHPHTHPHTSPHTSTHTNPHPHIHAHQRTPTQKQSACANTPCCWARKLGKDREVKRKRGGRCVGREGPKKRA
eukprot:1945051-Rhodomonas_salina.1